MEPQLEWSVTAQGGELQLYEVNAENSPHRVIKTIEPAFNSFVLFRVQQNSWHSVAEVIGENSSRLSLNGWFLAEERKWQNYSISKKPFLQLKKFKPKNYLEVLLLKMINGLINRKYY